MYHEKLFQTGRDEKIVEREAEKWLQGDFDKQLEKLFDKYAAPEYYCYVQGVCRVSNPLFKLATQVVTMRVSTANVEVIFSQFRRVKDKKRTSLDSDLLLSLFQLQRSYTYLTNQVQQQ